MKTKTYLYRMIKGLNIALSTGVVLCCLFFGYIYACNFIGMPAPRLGPMGMYVVISDSMVPVFQTGDAIFLVDAKPEQLEVGDIIAFYAFEENVTIIHRVIQKDQTQEGYSFRTQGDNNNVADSFVTPEYRLIGKYMFRIPRMNIYLERIQAKPWVMISPVILLAAVQGIFGCLEKVWKPVKREDAVQEGEAPNENQACKAGETVE